ncbi:hypothetical protein [Rheinheimera salexigens]|uniref:Orphan protein n=1 Tax=Rheinheimera salexigens TaxID=1628148 RepID=A0A1E7Q8B1_9GAMM|nr:hypothetical protein [Rheinheimera salexigens]OEY70424.1 hypothetical protein BI198_13215 [Rheinheimera salexigens]
MANQQEPSIANFSALKTAIANGEEQLVQQLLTDQPMHVLEKSYLIDLAKLNNNHAIIKLLEQVAVKN